MVRNSSYYLEAQKALSHKIGSLVQRWRHKKYKTYLNPHVIDQKPQTWTLKINYSFWSERLQESIKGLNSSLAQFAAELWLAKSAVRG